MLQLATYSIYISTIKNIPPTLIGKSEKKYLYLHRQYKSTLYESDTYIRQATSL